MASRPVAHVFPVITKIVELSVIGVVEVVEEVHKIFLRKSAVGLLELVDVAKQLVCESDDIIDIPPEIIRRTRFGSRKCLQKHQNHVKKNALGVKVGVSSVEDFSHPRCIILSKPVGYSSV